MKDENNKLAELLQAPKLKDGPIDAALINETVARYLITPQEAEERLKLLYNSSIFTEGDPADPETRGRIDMFLCIPTEVARETVLFDIFLNMAMDNEKFVSEYDRLAGADLTRILKTETELSTDEQEQLTAFCVFVQNIFIPELAEN